EACGVSAGERLAAVLDRTAAQQAATRVLAEGRAQAANLQTIGGLFDIASAEQARERYQGLLGQRLAPEVAAGLVDDAGMGRLVRSLRETELAGHDLDTVLDEVLTGRGLGDANSVADVLRWRVRWHAEHRDPQRVVDPRDWTTLLPPQEDGPVAEYVQALAQRATHRQAQLGRDTAVQAPGWAVEALGAVPAVDTPERTAWEQRAGIAAAYRELRGIDDEQTSLGAAPSREQELARALWGHAVEALGRPADVTDHRALGDAVLYQQVERWERELAAAPGWVAEQLGQAYEAAHEERIAHQLATAELAALPADDPRREELAGERDRAGMWADWHTERAATYEAAHEVRQAWATGTREQEQQARLAAEELDRRGLPTHRDLTPEPEPGPVQEREPTAGQNAAPAGVQQDVDQHIEQEVVEQDVERDVAQTVEPVVAEPVAATREERQEAWRTRPDRLLGEPALAEALTRAEQARDTALAADDRLRAQIPGLTEKVAARPGEQEAALEPSQAQLAAVAELHEGMDAAERGFGAAQREMWQIQQQGGAAARAGRARPTTSAATPRRKT
ncbi:MAG: hypothetical protein L0K86_26790, partial [Actinomycetia bacterium]|nr:hypothetical protein [Actinomycetes bacterium]